MVAGHFGLAAGVKRWAPRLPLWALMIGARFNRYSLQISEKRIPGSAFEAT